jgi:hypothetical protein
MSLVLLTIQSFAPRFRNDKHPSSFDNYVLLMQTLDLICVLYTSEGPEFLSSILEYSFNMCLSDEVEYIISVSSLEVVFHPFSSLRLDVIGMC